MRKSQSSGQGSVELNMHDPVTANPTSNTNTTITTPGHATPPPPIVPNSVPPCNIEVLQIKLCNARNAQQTAEIALAHEREAKVTEGVYVAINDAIRSQQEAFRDRDKAQMVCKQAQDLIEKAQCVIRSLEYELASLFLEKQLLERRNGEPYSPLGVNPARYNRHHHHTPMTTYHTRTPAARSPRSTPTHATPSSPFAPSNGLCDEGMRLSSLCHWSWVHNPPFDAMEHPHGGLGLA